MKKVLFLALLAVAFLAMPAAASVQNVKISGDIETSMLYRNQFDLGAEDGEFMQNVILTQTRLRVDADLTDNVAATVGLINERAWNEESDSDNADDIDIDLAYVTLREMLYSPLTVVVGRQEFAFGNSFVMDSGGSRNVTHNNLAAIASDLTKEDSLDAVRMTLDYNPLTLDVIYAKVDATTVTGELPQDDDVDLYGANANYQLGDDMNTVVEAYFWAKIDQSVKTVGDNAAKADSIYMPGVRASADILDGLNLQAELAWQFGNDATMDAALDNVKRKAMAAQVLSTYALPFDKTAEYKPVINAGYTYVSGDSQPDEPHTVGGDARTNTAWDPMFENQGTGTIANTLVLLSNLHVANVGITAVPMEDVTLSFNWFGYWLDKSFCPADGLNGDVGSGHDQTLLQPDGTNLTATVDSDKGLGNEFQIGLMYDYTEDVQIGAQYNIFVPGTALDVTDDTASATYGHNDKTATQFILSSKVAF